MTHNVQTRIIIQITIPDNLYFKFVRATPPEEFSQCSVNDLEELLMDNVGHCLFNMPTKVYCNAVQ